MVPKNLLIVHQQAGFTAFDQSLKTLRYIGSEIEHVSQIFFVVADNKIQLTKKVGDVHVIPSKNRYREFSGWSAGIDYGKSLMGGEPYNIILSNETMLNHRPFDEALLSAFILAFNKCFQIKESCYAGDVDMINAPPPYYYSNFDKYISTYLCGMNWSAVQLFDSIIPRADYEQNFINEFNRISMIANNSAIKDTDYGLMLEGYLYKNIPTLKIKKWWDHNNLNKNNYEKFRLKMLSILIEHGISQYLQEKGCQLENVKDHVRRNAVKKTLFFFKKIDFAVRWRANRYKKFLKGTL
jgi:hypothetical protein